MITAFLMLGILLIGALRRVNLYDAFAKGAMDGLKTALHTAPYLCAALLLTAALRGSGLLGALASAMDSVGLRAEGSEQLLPFLLLRPFSGSGALSALHEILSACGPDSPAARTAAVMMGSSETVLYIVSVYLGAAGVRGSGYVIPVAFAAMFAGMITAVLVV